MRACVRACVRYLFNFQMHLREPASALCNQPIKLGELLNYGYGKIRMGKMFSLTNDHNVQPSQKQTLVDLFTRQELEGGTNYSNKWW